MTVLATIVVLALQAFATNAELGYRFTLPEGFIAFPEGRTQPDVVDCWTEGASLSPNGALILCVHRLHGTLPRDAMRPDELPPGTRLHPFQWKGFEIQGLRSDTAQGGVPVVIFVAQVPLRGEAVQLVAAGPRDQADRAQAIMTSTLATLEGETNWLTATERSERLGKGVGAVFALVIVAIAARIWRNRRARSA